MQVGNQIKGKPTKTGPYIVQYKKDPLNEYIAWYIVGKGVSIPYNNVVEATLHNKGRDNFKTGHKELDTIIYYREITSVGKNIVDMLKDANEQSNL